MTAIVFYTNPMSRGQIVRWMLEEVGQPYEQRILDYEGAMKSPEYLAINPMGKVPAIVHDGHVVTECAAICAYLADAFPDAGLAPPTADRADYYRWMFFAAGPVETAVTNHAAKVDPSPEMQRSFGYGSFDLTIATLASLFGGREYVCGDRFSAADVYVGSHVIWGVLFGIIPDCDAFASYRARLLSRPAYLRAKAIDDALIAESSANTQ